MIGFSELLGNRLMLGSWNDTGVTCVLVGVENSLLFIGFRDRFPQFSSTAFTPISHREGNHLLGFNIHSEPQPLLILLVAHKTQQFVSFDLKPLNQNMIINLF